MKSQQRWTARRGLSPLPCCANSLLVHLRASGLVQLPGLFHIVRQAASGCLSSNDASSSDAFLIYINPPNHTLLYSFARGNKE